MFPVTWDYIQIILSLEGFGLWFWVRDMYVSNQKRNCFIGIEEDVNENNNEGVLRFS